MAYGVESAENAHYCLYLPHRISVVLQWTSALRVIGRYFSSSILRAWLNFPA